jgi:hypothetical protein
MKISLAQHVKEFFRLSCRKRFATAFLTALFLSVAAALPVFAQVTASGSPPNVKEGACGGSWTQVCISWNLSTGLCDTYGTPVCNAVGDCEAEGTADDQQDRLVTHLRSRLEAAAASLESWLDTRITQMLQSELEQLENIEQWTLSWWQTMWSYNLLPGLQAITRQLNTNLALQTFTLQSNADATDEMETIGALKKHEIEDQVNLRPSEQVCVAGTTAGGYGRVTGIARAMRLAWENESVAHGLNKVGDIGAPGASSTEAQRHKDFRDIFCDPDANGGRNNCGASIPAFYNADVQPAKYLYDKLTIDVNKDPRLAKAAETIINNMVGVPSADPIHKDALGSQPGGQTFLARRSWLARYAAIRSVPQLVAGWRMPGSKMGDWVKDLRSSVGVAPGDISENPSYKEIMHAVAVDRFNSGKYAAGMITDENKIEMEKLSLNAFYLMQLRDYYELLERTALALSVQVSMMSGQMTLPDVSRSAPARHQ